MGFNSVFKGLNVNKEFACRKVLSYTNKDQIRKAVVRYLDKSKCQWFNNKKEMKINCHKDQMVIDEIPV
jgi:histidyl-tRNA synthetase